MATSAITNTIKDATGAAVANVVVEARLRPGPGFRISDNSEVAGRVATTSDSSGDWSLTLEESANITPAGSWWQITEYVPADQGGTRIWLVTVGPSDATLVASLLSAPPAGPTNDYLTVATGDLRYLTPSDGDLRYLTPSAADKRYKVSVNVKDYGATGDGVTNDYTAIVAAINAAAQTINGTLQRCVVDFPQGEYFIGNNVLDLSSYAGITLRGSGGRLGAFGRPPQSYINGTAAGGCIKLAGGVSQNISLENLLILSNNASAIGALVIQASAGIAVRNCTIRSFAGGPAVEIDNSFWVRFQECSFISPSDAIPSVNIRSMATIAGVNLAPTYLIKWRECVFDNGNVKFTHEANTATLWGLLIFDDCGTENTNDPLLDIYHSAPGSNSMQYIRMDDCFHYDRTAGGSAAYIRAQSTSGAGALAIVDIRMRNCQAQGTNDVIERGTDLGGATFFYAVDIDTRNGKVGDGTGAISAAGQGVKTRNNSGTVWSGANDTTTTLVGSTNGPQIGLGLAGEAHVKIGLTSSGFRFGPGGASGGYDTTLARSGVGVLALTGGLTVSTTLAVTGATTTAAITASGLVTANGGVTYGDGQNLVVGSTTGTKIGTATSQKLGVWNATPIVQPAVTADLLDSLQAIGLIASGGGNTPLDLTGGAFRAGAVGIGTGTQVDASTQFTISGTTDRRIGIATTTAVGGGGNQGVYLFTDTSTSRAAFYWDNTNVEAHLRTIGNTQLKFDTNNTLRLTLDSAGLTVADAHNIVVGTTTGTKIGTATSQKLGFFNATPIVQPTSTTDLRTAIINLGLLASGGATPLDLNGGDFTTTGAVGIGAAAAAATARLLLRSDGTNQVFVIQDSGATAKTTFSAGGNCTLLTMAQGGNIALATASGTRIGTATNQLLGFHNAVPTIQRAGAAQVAVATTGATNVTPFGYTTAAQADGIVTLLNEIRAALVEKGIIKGSA